MDGIAYAKLKALGKMAMKETLIEGKATVIIEQTLYDPSTGLELPQKNTKQITAELINARMKHLQDDLAGYQEMLADFNAIP